VASSIKRITYCPQKEDGHVALFKFRDSFLTSERMR